ncbi:hypothetical protein O181_007323 [Austropuccinia psidii MF-1]|uniref:CCHC-type domain-containing protein n=1 Tax=Austropuccinia psidii MF-1 TaxID=1389203 RepID=A0A9Q3BM70_9BASI|nr:hypothetical protein [Austropuccinia psidii MF-1]
MAFDQLITTALLERREEKPTLRFVGQVTLNSATQHSSPFVYQVANTPVLQVFPDFSPSTLSNCPWHQATDVRRPPDHIVNKFGTACFHSGRPGHWCLDCLNKRGVANPNLQPSSTFFHPRLRIPDEQPPSALGS